MSELVALLLCDVGHVAVAATQPFTVKYLNSVSIQENIGPARASAVVMLVVWQSSYKTSSQVQQKMSRCCHDWNRLRD